MIHQICENCGNSLAIPDEYAGKRGRCTKCGATVYVGQAGSLPLPDGSREETTNSSRIPIGSSAPTSRLVGEAEAPATKRSARIRRLQELRDSGEITSDEYADLRNELLVEPDEVPVPVDDVEAAPEDRYAQIERLARMRDSGKITPQEFIVMKKKILGGSTAPNVRPVQERSSLAHWSFQLALLSFLCFGWLCSIPAIVLGILAHVKMSGSATPASNAGRATAGIVLGIANVFLYPFLVGFGIGIVYPNILRARIQSNEYSAIGNLRAIIGAEASYNSARGVYTSDFLDLTLADPPYLDGDWSGPRNGYSFDLLDLRDGECFWAIAKPVLRGRTGERSFAVNLCEGVIYRVFEDGQFVPIGEDTSYNSDTHDTIPGSNFLGKLVYGELKAIDDIFGTSFGPPPELPDIAAPFPSSVPSVPSFPRPIVISRGIYDRIQPGMSNEALIAFIGTSGRLASNEDGKQWYRWENPNGSWAEILVSDGVVSSKIEEGLVYTEEDAERAKAEQEYVAQQEAWQEYQSTEQYQATPQPMGPSVAEIRARNDRARRSGPQPTTSSDLVQQFGNSRYDSTR